MTSYQNSYSPSSRKWIRWYEFLYCLELLRI